MCILYHERQPVSQNSLNVLNFPHDVLYINCVYLTHKTLVTTKLCWDQAEHVQINFGMMLYICRWLYFDKYMFRSPCRQRELEIWTLIEYGRRVLCV